MSGLAHKTVPLCKTVNSFLRGTTSPRLQKGQTLGARGRNCPARIWTSSTRQGPVYPGNCSTDCFILVLQLNTISSLIVLTNNSSTRSLYYYLATDYVVIISFLILKSRHTLIDCLTDFSKHLKEALVHI